MVVDKLNATNKKVSIIKTLLKKIVSFIYEILAN